MPNLTTLSLNETGVTDAGLKHLESAKKLQQLSLRLTQVTPEGVAALQAALPDLKIAYDR